MRGTEELREASHPLSDAAARGRRPAARPGAFGREPFRTQPLALQAAPQQLIAGTQGVSLQLRAPPDLTLSEPAQAEAIVHCVQQAIINTIRHARVQELTIELRRDVAGGHCDHGVRRWARRLAGMRERFELLGGSLAHATP